MPKTPNIHEQVSLLIDEAYTSGLVAGRNEVLEALNAVLDQFAAPGASASERPPKRGPVADRLITNGSVGGSVRRRHTRRTLTPSEQRALDVVNRNPAGASFQELKSLGVGSPATLYALVRRRKIRRVEDPKPHLNNQPWVRFYPITKEAPHDAN